MSFIFDARKCNGRKRVLPRRRSCARLVIKAHRARASADTVFPRRLFDQCVCLRFPSESRRDRHGRPAVHRASRQSSVVSGGVAGPVNVRKARRFETPPPGGLRAPSQKTSRAVKSTRRRRAERPSWSFLVWIPPSRERLRPHSPRRGTSSSAIPATTAWTPPCRS